jgi:hypothetical protein
MIKLNKKKIREILAHIIRLDIIIHSRLWQQEYIEECKIELDSFDQQLRKELSL